MGEVYRARDLKLGREVAIKVLPDAFARDSERLARFEREARLLASLNHPSIAAIHAIEEAEGLRFIVLELVPGETLAARLLRGPLAVSEALETCRQIAEALAAAHEKGVIHRDLKPANVGLTPAGKVKLLDFGLAKLLGAEDADSDLARSPTLSAAGTREGAILGTAHYMSPEQARAQPLDKRTDVWSFGCILYEVLARRKVFAGATLSDTIAAILEREPDWQALPESTSSGVRSLLRRCLHKERDRRLHDIADAGLEIEDAVAELSGALPTGAATGQRRTRTRLTALLPLALASAGLGALTAWLAIASARPPRDSAPRVAQLARLTHDPGLSEWPSWSPDGAALAFASNRSGNLEIYMRRVEGGQEINVTDHPADDFQPALSPDGDWLAFVSTRTSRTGLIKTAHTFGLGFRTFGGDLWIAPALGGQARRLAQEANFPAWHPDGKRIAFVTGQENHRSVVEVDTEGGTPRTLVPGDSSTWEIVRLQYSPDARWLSFEAADERIRLLPATGGAPRDLLAGSSHAWEATSQRLLYLARDPSGGTRLMAVAVEPATGALRGEPWTAGLVTGFLQDLAVSSDGRHLVVSELEGSLNLTRLPLAPGGGAPAGPEEQLSSGRVIDRYPDFSPDGRRIVHVSQRLGRQEVWILDLETRRYERLRIPGDDLAVTQPVWSPDGRQIVTIRTLADGSRSLWLATIDGSHAESLVTAPVMQGPGFTREGRKILYSASVGNFMQLFELDLATRTSRQLTASAADSFAGAYSPDGRHIVLTSNVGAPSQLFRMSTAGGELEPLTTGYERMRHAFFSPDGRWIYVQPSHRNIQRMPASGGPLQNVTSFPESGLFLEEPTLSPDGRHLVYCRWNGGSSLWLMTLGDASASSP
jgi:Tol biopolymer transport system component